MLVDVVEADPDLGELIRFDGVLAPLRDPARFAELRVHPELGTICWPGGVDLDPDVVYARATGKPIDVSHAVGFRTVTRFRAAVSQGLSSSPNDQVGMSRVGHVHWGARQLSRS